jgi:hypothetical protein
MESSPGRASIYENLELGSHTTLRRFQTSSTSVRNQRRRAYWPTQKKPSFFPLYPHRNYNFTFRTVRYLRGNFAARGSAPNVRFSVSSTSRKCLTLRAKRSEAHTKTVSNSLMDW